MDNVIASSFRVWLWGYLINFLILTIWIIFNLYVNLHYIGMCIHTVQDVRTYISAEPL